MHLNLNILYLAEKKNEKCYRDLRPFKRFHIDIILIPHFLLFSKQDIFTTRRECASCCYPCKDNDVRMVTRFLNMACFLTLTVV